MSGFDNVLYHHVNVTDKADALVEFETVLDLYYSAD